MNDLGDARRLVAVTGAAGSIGSLVRTSLGERWELRACDVRPAPGVELLDVTDLERCRERFAGVDAVVHLAANPEPQADWEDLRGPNLDGAYAVARGARDCAVRRLVLASSLQAVSAHADSRQRRAGDPARPANLYGATKAWAEALGAWIAATSDTSVIALRIGFFAERPPTGSEGTPGNLAAWLSHADCIRLIRAAVEADVSGFTVVGGVSANRHRLAELGDAEERIGYAPADDAWAPGASRPDPR